jgi:hypothetical protein
MNLKNLKIGQTTVLGAEYGLHVLENPNKTFSFVGNVPADLAYIKEDGSKLTDDEIKQLHHAQSPGMVMKSLKIKNRVFKTKEEALQAAKKLGHKVNE